MLPGVDPSIPARDFRAASMHGHSTTESPAIKSSFYDKSPAIKSLLAVTGTRAYDTRGNSLHLILAVEFHLLQLNFFQEVFRIQVGRLGDFLKFCFVLPVL